MDYSLDDIYSCSFSLWRSYVCRKCKTCCGSESKAELPHLLRSKHLFDKDATAFGLSIEPVVAVASAKRDHLTPSRYPTAAGILQIRGRYFGRQCPVAPRREQPFGQGASGWNCHPSSGSVSFPSTSPYNTVLLLKPLFRPKSSRLTGNNWSHPVARRVSALVA